MKRILVSLVSLAIIISIGEVLARRRYGDGFLSLVDPQLHHERRPFINIERRWGSGEPFRFITNSLGWRDKTPGHRIKKVTDKEKRIVFLGDSFTEAVGYNQEDTFVGAVEEILKQEGFDYEILNGGTVSYTPLIEYIRLKRFYDKGYKADVVILLFDLSDIQDEVLYNKKYIFDDDNNPIQLKGVRYRQPLRGLLNSSCLFRSMAVSLKKFYDTKLKVRLDQGIFSRQTLAESEGIKEGLSTKDEEVITSDDLFNMSLAQQSHIRADWEIHRPSLLGWAQDGLHSLQSNVKKIKRLCEEKGILLLVVIYPWPQQLYTKEDPTYYKVLRDYFPDLYTARESFYGTKPSEMPSLYEATISSFCNQHSIDLINLYPEFAKEDDWHNLFIPNDIHLNKNGHSFMAKKIADKLLQKIE